MANASVTQAINSYSIGRAIQQARMQCANSPRWLNAVNRAAVELTIPGWQFDGETLRIASTNTPGVKYTVNAHGCTCKAAQADKPCKHRAAWRLLIKAAEMTRVS